MAVLAAAACSRPPAPEAPAPHAAYEPAPPPPLMGGPREEDGPSANGLLGGPPRGAAPERPGIVTLHRGDGATVVTMRPIPNPGPYEVAKARARAQAEAAARPAPALTAQETPHAPVALTPPAPPKTAEAPIAAAAAAARPGKPLARPPATPFVQTMPLAPPSDPRLGRLQAAVAADVAAGSKLAVPDAVWSGGEATVTLGTPPGLLAMLQREAARLGLTSAAQKASVTARLYGEGYTITPADSQTLPLAAGQATTFSWKVKPTAGRREALRADLDAGLMGGPDPQVFAIAALEQPAPVAGAAPEQPSTAEAVAKPVLIAILAVLGLVALMGMWRNAAARRAAEAIERRRQRRPASNYTLGSAPPGPGRPQARPAQAEAPAEAEPEREPSV